MRLPGTMRALPAALATALLLGGATAMAEPTDLNQSAWTLAELPGQSSLTAAAPTLRLSGGRVSGSDGCNRYHGTYQAEGDSFQVQPTLVSTRMACAEPVMKRADAFITALLQARSTRVDGDRLELLDEGGSVLARLTAQTRDIAGSAWQVTGYNNGRQAVVSVLRDTTVTLEFGAQGQLAGSAGCNRYSGAYSASGETLSIGQLAATRMMCAQPDQVMEQEAAFLRALQGATVLRMDGDRLELRGADGALLVAGTRSTP